MYIIITVIAGTLILIGIVAYFITSKLKKEKYEGVISRKFDEIDSTGDYDQTWYFLLVQTNDGGQKKVRLPKKIFDQFSEGEQVIKVQGETYPRKK